jgi:hypothetical protein
MFAVLAILYLDLFMNWPLLETPWRDWFVLTLIVFFLLAIGLLPFIDNFANVGGFVCGILVGLIIIPRISFGKWDRRFKIAALVLAVPTLITVYFLAFYFFYKGDTVNSCSWCQIIDCIPQGTSWCS